ncbi:hypothetical protein, partial [Burkholderia stabilis]
MEIAALWRVMTNFDIAVGQWKRGAGKAAPRSSGGFPGRRWRPPDRAAARGARPPPDDCLLLQPDFDAAV